MAISTAVETVPLRDWAFPPWSKPSRWRNGDFHRRRNRLAGRLDISTMVEIASPGDWTLPPPSAALSPVPIRGGKAPDGKSLCTLRALRASALNTPPAATTAVKRTALPWHRVYGRLAALRARLLGGQEIPRKRIVGRSTALLSDSTRLSRTCVSICLFPSTRTVYHTFPFDCKRKNEDLSNAIALTRDHESTQRAWTCSWDFVCHEAVKRAALPFF